MYIPKGDNMDTFDPSVFLASLYIT